ncbi:unnamed protein product [Ilex paraguariensis]|uniref:Non-specific lipid-transfer protein n=1 Tax=Ilex paraguariensis TaxID=185542 RepID=A0ABC8RFS5_9AQUA
MAMLMKVACVVLVFMVVVAPHEVGALTCGQIQAGLAPCLGYLRGGNVVPPKCCDGIRALNSEAKTTADRQAACRCLQSAAKSISGINLGKAAGLPGRCGVNIPYKISPSTDCSKVK